MGIAERNADYGIATESNDLPLHLAAYVAPTEVHKLIQRRKQKLPRSQVGGDEAGATEVPTESGDVLTDFDRMALASHVSIFVYLSDGLTYLHKLLDRAKLIFERASK